MLFEAPPPISPSKAPRSEVERLEWVRLARSEGVGPVNFVKLIAKYGSARAVIEAFPTLRAKNLRLAPVGQAEREIERGAQAGAQLLCLGAPEYPALLDQIDRPPPFLWALGAQVASRRPGVAIVGARNASALGARFAHMIAQGLSEAGARVISGFARGVDSAAHAGSLLGPGGGAAAVAGGVDHLYPPENEALYAQMLEGGAFYSEAPMGLVPQAKHFPRRNRIISGLSHAVVVIEAAEKSGSLITARFAGEQGRDILAAPGHPLDPRAGGCNALLREGATLIRSAEDVLEALSSQIQPLEAPQGALKPAAAQDAPAAIEASNETSSSPRARILAQLSPAPIEMDALARAANLEAAALMGVLTELELEGLIERQPGGMIALSRGGAA